MPNYDNAILIATDFIKKWEQLGLNAKGGNYTPAQAESLPLDTILHSYPDGGSRSIGWGSYDRLSDGTKVTSSLTITKERADAELYSEVRKKESEIRDMITADLNDNQYAAMISFAYNAGSGALKYNNLLDTINSGGDVATVLKATAITEKGKSGKNAGLINRRKDEAQLYSNPNYSTAYSYYLRNASTINYAVIGGAIIGMTGYVYLLSRKKKF